MARINVEESLFTSPRFQRLQSLIGPTMAAGAWLMAARVAQSYWKRGGVIPLEDFELLEFHEQLLACKLCEKRDGGVYLRGSEDHFGWLQSRLESAAKGGKASAEVRKERYGSAAPHPPKEPKTPKQIRSKMEANAKRVEASYSYSSSSSNSGSSSDSDSGSRSRAHEDQFPSQENLDPGQRGGMGGLGGRADLAAEAAPPPPEKILHVLARIWNEHCRKLPKVKGLSSSRIRQADARWRENPSEIYWIGIIEKIADSNFCNGANDRGWLGNFDFMIRPETHLKALEGAYDNRVGLRAKTIAERREEANGELYKRVQDEGGIK